MRRRFGTAVLGLSVTACTSIGPGTVSHDRIDYATAIGNSWKEQTLLNIVKLRYAELDAIEHGHATTVISEATGLPYKEDHFRHEFRRIADLAGLDFQFRDLRRGGLTETADAGATLMQLHATSGHKSMQSSEPYLVPTTDQADEAIRKRERLRRSKRNEN